MAFYWIQVQQILKARNQKMWNCFTTLLHWWLNCCAIWTPEYWVVHTVHSALCDSTSLPWFCHPAHLRLYGSRRPISGMLNPQIRCPNDASSATPSCSGRCPRRRKMPSRAALIWDIHTRRSAQWCTRVEVDNNRDWCMDLPVDFLSLQTNIDWSYQL